jgi:methionine aminopeptidase
MPADATETPLALTRRARRINRELARAVRDAGAATIQDLVGHEVGVGSRVAHAAPAPDRARD